MRAARIRLILLVKVGVKEKGKIIILKKTRIITIRLTEIKKKEKAVKTNLL